MKLARIPRNEPNSTLAFQEQEERDQFSDEMISLRFLAQIDRIMENKDINKKKLAEHLKTSPSYITQLFQGDKLVNIRLLTKLKRSLNINIEIICYPIGRTFKADYMTERLEISNLALNHHITEMFLSLSDLNDTPTITVDDESTNLYSANYDDNLNTYAVEYGE